MTAETLLSILKNLKSEPASGCAGPDGVRRRTLPRVGMRVHLTILPCDNPASVKPDKPIVVTVRNLSARGLCFVVRRPMAVGQRFLISLRREKGGTAHLLGKVERCSEVAPGTFDVGGSINLNVTPAEMQLCLRQARIAA